MEVNNNLDLLQNQIINVVLHSLPIPPDNPVDGQMYHNSGTKTIYHYDAVTVAWKPLGSGTVIGGDGLLESTTGGIVTLSVNVDGSTLEINTDIVRVKDGGIVAAKLATDAVTAIKILNGAVTFAKMQNINGMTILGKSTAGAGSVTEISLINDNTLATASATNIASAGSIKAYVDGLLAGLGKPMGPFDASAATVLPGTAAIKNGSYWRVQVAGTVQGIVMQKGDVLFADKDNPSPTLATDWYVLQANADQATANIMGLVMLATVAEVQTGTDANKVVTPATLSALTATEARAGLIEIATQAEVNAGTDNARAITPLKMAVYVAGQVAGGTIPSNLGNGVATEFTITHNLNSVDVHATVKKVADGSVVLVDWRAATVNTVVVTFAKAPALNAYRIVIKK